MQQISLSVKLLFISAYIMAVSAGAATTYYVATNGCDDTGVGSIVNPWLTISNGVANANAPGDTVMVSNGIYIINESIYVDQSITVKAFSADPVDTIVDCDNNTYAFWLNHSGVVLSGLTITNGLTADANAGGGIWLQRGLVTNCVVTGCQGVRAGGVSMLAGVSTMRNSKIIGNICTSTSVGSGGVYMHGNAQLFDSDITGNTAYYRGGGIYMGGSGAVVSNCNVIDNIATNSGGGIFARYSNDVINCRIIGNKSKGGGTASGGGLYLEDNKIAGNYTMTRVTGSQIISNESAAHAGGVMMNKFAGSLRNCTVAHNTATTFGGGVYLYNDTASSNFLHGCIISNNTTGSSAGGVQATQVADCNQSPTIANSIIVDNRAGTFYGGVNLSIAAEMINCVIRGNMATNHTGGVNIDAGSRMQNCEISANKALTDRGGGVRSAGEITSCTIAGNTAATDAGGMYITGGSVTNTIIYSNSANDFDDINWDNAARSNSFWNSCSTRPLNPEQGNITGDPKFANESLGDYRLSAGSPCINAGVYQPWMIGALDIDGRSRIDRFSRLVDMGCYEYLSRGTLYNVR